MQDVVYCGVTLILQIALGVVLGGMALAVLGSATGRHWLGVALLWTALSIGAVVALAVVWWAFNNPTNLFARIVWGFVLGPPIVVLYALVQHYFHALEDYARPRVIAWLRSSRRH